MNLYNELAKLITERDEIQNKIDNLKEIAKQNKDQKWTPQLNDKYYVPTPLNEDFYYQRVWQNESDDVFRFNVGLVCEAPIQAIEIGKKMYYRQWFESLSDVTEEDWGDGLKSKWFIAYFYNDNKLDISFNTEMRGANAYFSSENKLKEAIEIIGEENIKKYVLGVK